MAIKNNKNQTSGLAIASLVLGIVSFFPLIGVILGILAIVFGFIARSNIKRYNLKGLGFATAGIILGILGILFTFILYGSLFYFGFVAKDGPFQEVKIEASKQILTQDTGLLELYKQKYGRYPTTLEEAQKANYTIFGTDHFLKPFCYKVSENGKSYELKSPGPDKECNTNDDIYPNK